MNIAEIKETLHSLEYAFLKHDNNLNNNIILLGFVVIFNLSIILDKSSFVFVLFFNNALVVVSLIKLFILSYV